jgi:quinol monooxygenase YgiN
MGRTVIVVFRPKRGREHELEELLKEHVPILRKEQLVTDRKPFVMKSSEGVFVEVFEWKSQEAIKQAHTNMEVGKLWDRFGQVCDYDTAVNVKEFHDLFSEFASVNWDRD